MLASQDAHGLLQTLWYVHCNITTWRWFRRPGEQYAREAFCDATATFLAAGLKLGRAWRPHMLTRSVVTRSARVRRVSDRREALRPLRRAPSGIRPYQDEQATEFCAGRRLLHELKPPPYKV
jgi:hypothetical protein